MPMTLDQIVEETRRLPPDAVAELVDRILLARHGIDDTGLDPATQAVLRQRVDDIRSGREPGIDGDEVMARARRIVGR